MAAKNTTKKKASVIVTPNAKALVSCTYNNTIITIVNQNGETIVWCAPGVIGFKGAKRSTPYAATLTAEEAAKKAVEKGVQSIDIIVTT